MDDRIGRYVVQAWEYYRQGLAELGKNPHKACESVWGAVDRMTRAVCLKYMGREEPIEGKETWRDFLTECFMRAGFKGEEAKRLSHSHRDFVVGLHGSCFYGGKYYEDIHREMVERDAKEYLETLQKVVEVP